MKTFGLLFVAGLLIFSCTSRYKVAIDYYSKNAKSHKSISDELMKFCYIQKCDVTVRRSRSFGNFVFEYHFNSPKLNVIEYDSLLKRHDPNPNLTSSVDVPIVILEFFKHSIYNVVKADSSEVFFGYSYYPNSEFQYGVLITGKSIVDNCIKKLDSNVCIFKQIVP